MKISEKVWQLLHALESATIWTQQEGSPGGTAQLQCTLLSSGEHLLTWVHWVFLFWQPFSRGQTQLLRILLNMPSVQPASSRELLPRISSCFLGLSRVTVVYMPHSHGKL